MPMSLQEISDHIEIKNLLIDYCTAIDSKNFDALDEVFTEDAHIDYTCVGGPKGPYLVIKAYLKKSLPQFPSYQHLTGNTRIRLDGDHATARSICHNPMVIELPEGGRQTAYFGIWYADKLIRTKDGWRLRERVEEFAYTHNLPPGFQAVEA